MALVGTLALTSTMSMNVMERTREIGVMRAIGATPRIIIRLLLTESLLFGFLSLFFAFGLSLIMSYGLGQWLGTMAFRSPLGLTLSFPGLLMWLGIVILGSIGATIYPAKRAIQLPTREALAYA